jgi:hypothetical protein
MDMSRKLSLYEEIMLLALRDKEGTIVSGTRYEYAVGGAILAELFLRKRIEIERKRKKTYVRLLDLAPTGDRLLDECLEHIHGVKRPKSLADWVSKFAGLKNLRHRIALRLCQAGILKADEDKVLLLFTRRIYPEVDPGPERQLIQELDHAIFSSSGEADTRTAVLISLAKAADLLKVVFDKKKLKSRKARVEDLIHDETLGKAAKEAIEAVEAAEMIACTAPLIAST